MVSRIQEMKTIEIAEFMVWDWEKVLLIEIMITDDLTGACRFAQLFNWVWWISCKILMNT